MNRRGFMKAIACLPVIPVSLSAAKETPPQELENPLEDWCIIPSDEVRHADDGYLYIQKKLGEREEGLEQFLKTRGRQVDLVRHMDFGEHCQVSPDGKRSFTFRVLIKVYHGKIREA